MSEALKWLEENGPATVKPTRLTWERGPIDPESGVSSMYMIEGMDYANNPSAQEGMPNELLILFQSGIVPENGINGVTPEILLEVLIDRFEGYQSGQFACEENDAALTGMRDALAAIQRRRAERAERGVLNTMQK